MGVSRPSLIEVPGQSAYSNTLGCGHKGLREHSFNVIRSLGGCLPWCSLDCADRYLHDRSVLQSVSKFVFVSLKVHDMIVRRNFPRTQSVHKDGEACAKTLVTPLCLDRV